MARKQRRDGYLPPFALPPPPLGLPTWSDDQICWVARSELGGTLGGFATGVGSTSSPVALCHWKPSFTASKQLAPITPPGCLVQPEAKLPQLALGLHVSLAEETDSPGGTRPPGS
jgi:hypothetical protein